MIKEKVGQVIQRIKREFSLDDFYREVLIKNDQFPHSINCRRQRGIEPEVETFITGDAWIGSLHRRTGKGTCLDCEVKARISFK